MSMWNNKSFTENELSLFAKVLIYGVVIIPVFYVTMQNIIVGNVKNPFAFIITILGFSLFIISKISLFRKGIWFSFGTKKMSECMGNIYRVGYWLMVIGLIFTFSN